MQTIYKFLACCLISVLLVGCTSNTILDKPENLIPKEQMADLIVDLFLADGGKSIRNIEMKRNSNFYPQIFEKYKIDSVQFQESNYYYTSRIDDYDEILSVVEIKLNALKVEFEAMRKNEDSIRRHKLDSLSKSRLNNSSEAVKRRRVGNETGLEREIKD